jgi:radical SAM superfamily enzyme
MRDFIDRAMARLEVEAGESRPERDDTVAVHILGGGYLFCSEEDLGVDSEQDALCVASREWIKADAGVAVDLEEAI